MMSWAPLAAYRSITWLTPAVSCGAFDVYWRSMSPSFSSCFAAVYAIWHHEPSLVGHGSTSATLTFAVVFALPPPAANAPSRPHVARRRTEIPSRFTDVAPLCSGGLETSDTHGTVCAYSITSLRYGTPSAAGWALRFAAIVVPTMTARVSTYGRAWNTSNGTAELLPPLAAWIRSWRASRMPKAIAPPKTSNGFQRPKMTRARATQPRPAVTFVPNRLTSP